MASEPESHVVQALPVLSGCRPSVGRKLAFWLLVGMVSVLFVEVPAGSTMFPFFTVWGLLVVVPLYLLHSVFLAGLVFRFGRPRFWTLFAAGMLYGMYEAYITKVLWTSFRPEGPFLRVGGIAFFETIMLVFWLHPMLAFVIPLFFTEILCTNSFEIADGLPWWTQRSLQKHPHRWIGLLMAFLGFMQFVNSPSVASSFLSGTGNCLVLGLALLWWRRSGGAAYSLRELLPGPKGLWAFGLVLVVWHVFWGLSIKPHSIPGILQGQLTIWSLYATLKGSVLSIDNFFTLGSLSEQGGRRGQPYNMNSGLQRKFHGFSVAKSAFEAYLTRLLRALLIFLRVTAFTLASGTVAGSVNFSASNNCFCSGLGSGSRRQRTWPLLSVRKSLST